MKKFWNWIKNSDDTRILRLEGPIDEESFWGDEITPQMFRDELESGEGDVTVWINSPGGNVFAAAEIYTMLKDYKGSITVKIDAIAASAASVVAMAGDTVQMSPVAMLMIHDPSTVAMGNTKDMEKAMANGASAVIGAVLVVILVGGLIGVWMACGSVPAMLYYGIKLINPQMFLPLAFIICSITSLATGACWGTAATVGVALIGVAAGIGVPLPLAAGAIISGSHFGDKLSPLSDTTLLASATARADLYDHIVSMLYDTIPVTVICLVAYSILGAGYGSGASNLSEITAITDGIQAEFRINLWMLVPPMVTIFMAVKRVPSIICLLYTSPSPRDRG